MSEPAVRWRGRDDRTYPHPYRIIHSGVKGSLINLTLSYLSSLPFIFRPFRCDEKKKSHEEKSRIVSRSCLGPREYVGPKCHLPGRRIETGAIATTRIGR